MILFVALALSTLVSCVAGIMVLYNGYEFHIENCALDFLIPEDSWRQHLEATAFLSSVQLPRWRFARFETCEGSDVIVIPLWPLLVVSVVGLTGLSMAKRRTSATMCRKCGYDLTGNVSGRCPECGTPHGRCGTQIPESHPR